ncbi:Zinc finger BED domain-containing protein DAYSLEEPER [Rhynchospora pubera]|uniref:Zinc finger BED domain-containing protein DAYSLEEPER n=1 Tax=Rhynchospora pubera TaxID=906938 RepID=A0AAV8CWQ2_9POAL|nr:Zinc finger BED domain-containing protein DAYSLEEPER [Rhynchospora pubera]
MATSREADSQDKVYSLSTSEPDEQDEPSSCKNSIARPSKTHKKSYLRQRGETTIGNYTFDQEACRKDLVQMIVLHEHPLLIVDQVGFRTFVNNLQPLFNIPSHGTVRNDVMKLYMEQKKRSTDLLDSNECRVAITVDMWTVDKQKKSYMMVFAHFVDDSWRLQHRLLRFQHIPFLHTTDAFVENLMNVLSNWNLHNKLSTLTVNNCSMDDGVVDSIVRKLDIEQLLLGGSIFHMHCFAHILNLIIKDGLDVIGQRLKAISDSCDFWSSTPQRIEQFEEAAQQLCINSTKKLCFVKTQWNSTYIMLETALIYKDIFNHLKTCEAQYKTMPSDEDWENAKIISEKLKILFTATELLLEKKYTTANHYFARICEIRLALSNWLLDSNPIIANMASRVMENFQIYWSKIYGVMGIATILDPRFKRVLLEYYYEKFYPVGHESEVKKVVDLCRQLFREYKTRALKQEVVGCSEAMTDFDLFVERRKRQKVISTAELDHYLSQDLAPLTQNFSVLTWWMTNGYKFPTLQKIARDIYAIPVSTFSSKLAFSTGGQIISPRRHKLHPELIEALACTQNWLRAEFEDLGEHNPFEMYHVDEDED